MSLTLFALQDFINAMQTSLSTNSPKFTNFTTGSAAFALTEAVSGNAFALQYVAQQVYAASRLATSIGLDVDTYVADWGLTRVPAIASSGTVTFTRTNTTVPLLIPVGGLLQTNLTTRQFMVVADNSQSGFNPILNGYYMGTGVATVDATVQAQATGHLSNVLANTITKIVSLITGVSAVTNSLPFSNGADQETDDALKARFTEFVSSLSLANLGATNAAIASLQPNLTWTIIEYFDFAGSAFPGYTVVVDDGSGAIPAIVLTNVLAACNSVRAAGVKAAVHAPTNVPVAVVVQLTLGGGQVPAVVNPAVNTAVTNAINGKGTGNILHFGDVTSVIQTTPGVIGYTGLTLNGAATDVAITVRQLARMNGTVTFL